MPGIKYSANLHSQQEQEERKLSCSHLRARDLIGVSSGTRQESTIVCFFQGHPLLCIHLQFRISQIRIDSAGYACRVSVNSFLHQ